MLFEDMKRGGKLFSAYLFLGPDGSGKFEAAKNFAKTLNCPAAKPEPCGTCAHCKKIDSEAHPDVFFAEPKGASSSIGIDEIRFVIAKANLRPYEAAKKVFIIKGAHSMNDEAQNAFLKTLEEPPKDTVFVLISRSKDLLLPTIVSRCYAVNFSAASLLNDISPERFEDALGMRWSDAAGLKENLDILASYFRDIFLYKAVKNEAMLFRREAAAEIKEESQKYSLEELDRMIRKIITLRSYIDYNVNQKIIVDVLTNELRGYNARSGSSTGKAA